MIKVGFAIAAFMQLDFLNVYISVGRYIDGEWVNDGTSNPNAGCPFQLLSGENFELLSGDNFNLLDKSCGEEITINGSIQEVKGRDLKFLKEGTRIDELKILYSNDKLPIDDYQYGEGQNDIRLVIEDLTYRLIDDKGWVGDYYKYTLEQLRSNDAVP